MQKRKILLASVASLVLGSSAAHAAVVIPEGVAEALPGQGTGLCAASAIAANPTTDFTTSAPMQYNGSINAFIDAHKADRVEQVIRTLLDLSNNNASGLKISYGDFIDAALADGCKTGGCDFFVNDTSTAFGTRMRGFLNVTDQFANKELHIGTYLDDSLSITFYDKALAPYSVIFKPWQLGAATWRITEQVTFQKPGLYPVEILYTEITEHAAFEMSYFIGTFTDFAREANTIPIVKLDASGFQLFPATQFFQTLSGNPSYPDLDVCKQCERQFINVPGNNGCDPGYYCNEAAVCSPCDTAKLCGPTCSPCGGDTPFCVNINGDLQCAGCRNDQDCDNGFTCDPITKTCNECNENSDCPKGQGCVDKKCEPCSTSDECAGNSCNCCPDGANGKQMKCGALEPEGQPSCVECTTDAECGGAICNLAVGRCTSALPADQNPTACGEGKVNCIALETIVVKGESKPRYPFCLPGPIGVACAECRNDMDCTEGAFCLSGVCTACTRDKRCGMRCDSCGGDTPYCHGQNAAVAECVRCTSDTQCAGGASCNPMTHACDPAGGCLLTCGPSTPFCDGANCVECYADAQCPCGGTCDQASKRCSPSCKTNVDCLGNEHCAWNENETAKECSLGPMPDGVDCGGTLATICSARPGRHGGGAPGAAFVALSILALLGRRRLRGEA